MKHSIAYTQNSGIYSRVQRGRTELFGLEASKGTHSFAVSAAMIFFLAASATARACSVEKNRSQDSPVGFVSKLMCKLYEQVVLCCCGDARYNRYLKLWWCDECQDLPWVLKRGEQCYNLGKDICKSKVNYSILKDNRPGKRRIEQ